MEINKPISYTKWRCGDNTHISLVITREQHQDLLAYGIDISEELNNFLSDELSQTIDSLVIERLVGAGLMGAGLTDFWSRAYNTHSVRYIN